MKKLLASCALMLAMTAGVQAATADSVKTAFQQVSGQMPLLVKPAPLPGMWEVFMNDRLYYVDDDVKYVMNGQIYDLKTEYNVTAEHLRKARAEMFDAFPLKDAVKQVFGEGKRKLIVFSDVNCTYCRQLEQTYEKVGNLTVYTFIMPLLRGTANAENIVCAKDQAQAWHDWMSGKPLPKTGACDMSMLQRNLALAEQFGINSAPTMFFQDGERISGAIPAARLNATLNERR